MNYPNASAPARPVSRTLAAISKSIGQTAILSVALATASASIALAQQPQPLAPAPAAPAPVAKPKPPAAKPKPPAAKPAAPAPEAQQPAAPAPDQGQQGQPQQAQGGDQPQVQFIYSPWTKFCLKPNNDPAAKQMCFTGKDARIETGMPVVAAVIIEQDGEQKKILRVTLPLHMLLQQGTRVIVDQNQPLTAPYFLCIEGGCMADYEATPDLIAKMKKGQVLSVQAINQNHQPLTLPVPLADFGKAYDGPPTDPKVLEDQQKKLQEELQRRADEARKRLEQQQGSPQTSNAPPAAGPAPAPQ
jgi:invasion protein IalB